MTTQDFAERVAGNAVILVKGHTPQAISEGLAVLLPAIVGKRGVSKEEILDCQSNNGLLIGFTSVEAQVKAVAIVNAMIQDNKDLSLAVLYRLEIGVFDQLVANDDSLNVVGLGRDGQQWAVVRMDNKELVASAEVMLDFGFGRNFRTFRVELTRRNGDIEVVSREYREYRICDDGQPELKGEPMVLESLEDVAIRKVCGGKSLADFLADFGEDIIDPNIKDETLHREEQNRIEKANRLVRFLRSVVDNLRYKANGSWGKSFGLLIEDFIKSQPAKPERPSGKPRRNKNAVDEAANG